MDTSGMYKFLFCTDAENCVKWLQ